MFAAIIPAAALRVRTAIYESLQTILLFPRAGRRQRTEGVYKMVTRRYPYAIYYTIDHDANEVIVVSVRHAAQRPEYDDE